jgi:hypothetical protein
MYQCCTLEENGIDTILANPYKTKIIAEAKYRLVVVSSTHKKL